MEDIEEEIDHRTILEKVLEILLFRVKDLKEIKERVETNEGKRNNIDHLII